MKYSERAGTNLFAGVGMTLLVTVMGAAMAIAARFKSVRARLPQPGEGPTREEMEKGWYHMKTCALSEESNGTAPIRVVSTFKVSGFHALVSPALPAP
jgi:short subunit dehydrogenase-like uncharacterized protein